MKDLLSCSSCCWRDVRAGDDDDRPCFRSSWLAPGSTLELECSKSVLELDSKLVLALELDNKLALVHRQVLVLGSRLVLALGSKQVLVHSNRCRGDDDDDQLLQQEPRKQPRPIEPHFESRTSWSCLR